MEKLQNKLEFLLDKYSVDAKAVIKDCRTVEIDGKDYPVFAHRCERRFVELNRIVNNGTLVGVSVMRVAVIAEKGSDLWQMLAREFDLCQWILQDDIKSVMTMKNDNTMNVIAVTKKGVVCTIEVAATLAAGQEPVDKHEIISQRGIACDVVVDAQLKQDSIYVFTDKKETYTDVDFELYGLSAEEISIVRAAFALAQNKCFDEVTAAEKTIATLVSMAQKSAETGMKEVF